VLGLLVLASIGGIWVAPSYPLPEAVLDLGNASSFEDLEAVSMLPGFSTWSIFGHNVRALMIGGFLGVFSFGTAAIILLMIPLGLAGYLGGAVSLLGHNPWLFITAFVLPHGILEIPAAVISTAFVLRIGAALVSPPDGFDVGQGLILTVANFVKMFLFVVLPLLLAAAFIEAEITPLIVRWVYQ
jgi:uncharacterized membrane protein SpoIIM required for sporulation